MFNVVDEMMLESTVHRGEDSTRFRFYDGRCGLGINRLSIVDLDRGDQPLRNEEGDVHVVCNGEIYNHGAVASDLEATHELGSRSDAEVIVHLYEDHGDDCMKLLDGMFAYFAIGFYTAALVGAAVSMVCVLAGTWMAPRTFDWSELSTTLRPPEEA